MIAIKLEIDGLIAMDQLLAGWSRRLDDWTPIWDDVIKDYIETTKRQFRGSGAVDGLSRHSPLSPAYARAKSRTHPGRPILVRSGKLRRKATNPSVTKRPEELRIQIRSKIGRYHQSGTRFMPQRKVIRLAENKAQQDRIVAIIERHVQPVQGAA